MLSTSKVVNSVIYDWIKPHHRSLIYSIFRIIIRTVILFSLSTSFVKGNQFWKSFHGAENFILDFGIRVRWEEIFVSKDDFDIEHMIMPGWIEI